MNETPNKPFWRKVRWAAALLLWSLLAYAVSIGPVGYAVARQWLPAEAAGPFLLPATLFGRVPVLGEQVARYERFCIVRGLEDDGCVAEVDAAGNIRAFKTTTTITLDDDYGVDAIRRDIERARSEIERASRSRSASD